MKKETVICAMLATATCATAQNGKFPTSGVCADSIQTENDSIKANQEAEIKADKEAEIQAVTVTGHRPMYKMRNETRLPVSAIHLWQRSRRWKMY